MAGREKIDADGQILRICSGAVESEAAQRERSGVRTCGEYRNREATCAGNRGLQYGTSDGDDDEEHCDCVCDEKVKSSPRIVENRSPIVESQCTIELALSQSQRCHVRVYAAALCKCGRHCPRAQPKYGGDGAKGQKVSVRRAATSVASSSATAPLVPLDARRSRLPVRQRSAIRASALSISTLIDSD